MSTLTTIGIIWGDIGTSPLYSMSAIYNCEEECQIPSYDDLVGTLSCVIWSLTIITFIKYIIIILRFDYHGEGGIFALYLNITRRSSRRMSRGMRKLFLVLSVVGSSALIADSIITPALSVLSAIEGIRDMNGLDDSQRDIVKKLVVPITIVILLLLFALQQYGSTKVGRWFGPIMLLYFLSLMSIGIYNLSSLGDWGVLQAFSPHYAIQFFVSGRFSGYEAFKKLSSIILCVTGAEAVYSDLGHVGKLPIYISWIFVVYPSLVLNYAGQSAYLRAHPNAVSSAYWQSIPSPVYIPMLVVSTLATTIASQSLISGCFTLISSAVTLNLFMKVKVINTDATKRGQIYIPEINLILCIGAVILVIVFQKSMALAGAYGIAVVLTFNITNFLLGAGLYYVKWPKLPFILPILAIIPFVTIDGFFFASNIVFKFTHGGWITMVITLLMTAIMLCWMYGRNAKHSARKKIDSCATECTTIDAVLDAVKNGGIRRGHGIGVYLSPSKYDTGKMVVLSSSIQHTRDGEVVLTREDTPPVIIDHYTSGIPTGNDVILSDLSNKALPTA
jgi:KUP system potassium uptake protein